MTTRTSKTNGGLKMEEEKLLNTHSFDVNITIANGEILQGTFNIHRPTMAEKIQIGVLEAREIGGMSNVDVLTSNLARMIATFDTVIDTSPKWWKPRELHDMEVMQAVWDKIDDYLRKFSRRS
jgi:hypothetical protein